MTLQIMTHRKDTTVAARKHATHCRNLWARRGCADPHARRSAESGDRR